MGIEYNKNIITMKLWILLQIDDSTGVGVGDGTIYRVRYSRIITSRVPIILIDIIFLERSNVKEDVSE